MSEVARRLIVASLVAWALGGVSYGQASILPDSLRTNASSASNAANIGLPEFTGGVDPQRAGPREGAPSTEPAPPRDNRWMSNHGSGMQTPSTEPVRSSSGGPSFSSGAFGGNIATVAATQDPASREAQLESQTRSGRLSQPSAALSNTALSNTALSNTALPGSAAASSNTASSRVGLPNAAGTSDATPGAMNRNATGAGGLLGGLLSGAADTSASTAGTNSLGRTTATTSSGLDSSNPLITPPPGIHLPQRQLQATDGRAGGGMGFGATSNGMSLPTLPAANSGQNVGGQNFGGQNGTASTPFGSRGTFAGANSAGQMTASTSTTMPSTWTQADIQSLASMFNLSPNDVRLRDRTFVNDLYEQYVKYRQESEARSAQTIAAGQLASQRTAAAPAAAPRSASVQPSTVLYDPYGRPVSSPVSPAAVNVPDRDAASSTRVLALEKQLDRLIELQTREQLARANGQSTTAAAQEASSIHAVEQAKRQLLASGQFRPITQDASPASSPASGPASDQDVPRSPSDTLPDKAGLFAANPMRNTNPWVNIFLVCSLFFNVFLYICIHRMWYNYRDMNVSSRLTKSGIGGGSE